jgi:hypothetical protein
MQKSAVVGLVLVGAIAAVLGGRWAYENTPLGCDSSELPPPPKYGTPEWAATQKATEHLQGLFGSDMKNWQAYIYQSRPDDPNYREMLAASRDHWIIHLSVIRPKTRWGCNRPVLDGIQSAWVRKSDLQIMNAH